MSTHLFSRDLNKNYPLADYGEGIYIYDKQGKQYLDGSSGALVTSLGHGNQSIINSMSEQINKISFAHTSQFHTDILIEYANKLAELAPGELNYSYFVSGGSEGVETALKLARQYHIERGFSTKYKVIGRWPSFHGHTLGALSAGGYTFWRKPHTPNLISFPHINAPLSFDGSKKELEEYHIRCADELEHMILKEGPENISAFIFEPIIGTSGSAAVATDEYYEIIEKTCKKYDVLLIADEVMCGFGRTGEIFASDHWNLQPDMIVSGKGMSSGYAPLGLVMIHQKIYDTFKNGSENFLHGFTFSGNPVSVSAGLSVLKNIEEKEILSNVNKIGNYLKAELKKLREEFEFVGKINGKGLMWGIELVSNNKNTSFPRSANITNKLVQECLINGLIVYPSQKFNADLTGDSIIVAPPLIIKKEEVDELIDRLRLSLKNIQPLINN